MLNLTICRYFSFSPYFFETKASLFPFNFQVNYFRAKGEKISFASCLLRIKLFVSVEV